MRLAERVFITPARTARPRREALWAQGASRTRLDTESGSIATWVWGDGPTTVLLAHGWSGRGLQLGGFAAPLVERGLRVVGWDAPAHGESPGRTSNLPEMAETAAAVARAMGPVSGVVAHSLGAAAVILAVGRGDLEIRRLALIASPVRMEGVIERFGELTGFTPSVLAGMQSRLESRLRFSWQEIEPLTLAADAALAPLIVHDRDDRHVPASDSLALARACPEARLVLTSGLGHHRLLRDPEVIETATEYLTALSDAQAPWPGILQPVQSELQTTWAV